MLRFRKKYDGVEKICRYKLKMPVEVSALAVEAAAVAPLCSKQAVVASTASKRRVYL